MTHARLYAYRDNGKLNLELEVPHHRKVIWTAASNHPSSEVTRRIANTGWLACIHNWKLLHGGAVPLYQIPLYGDVHVHRCGGFNPPNPIDLMATNQ